MRTIWGMIRLETVLDSWKTIREDTALTVEEMPAEGFDARLLPDVMTFRELAQHILNASHAITGLLLDGMEDFTAPEFRQKMRGYFPPPPADADLCGVLRSAFDERYKQLKAQPPEFFAHIITRFDGQRLTRLEFIQMMKEHELTHRSQMFLVARMQGVVPVTTRRRQQQQKK
jgi:uncharacterized damage-inducible protein DinB